MTDAIEITIAAPIDDLGITSAAVDVIEILEDTQFGAVEITEDQTTMLVEIKNVTEENSVEIVQEPVTVAMEITVSGTTPGPRGFPGAPSGVLVQYPIAYPLSGHRICVLDDGLLIYASKDAPLHANKILGMTVGAASSGSADVQRGGVLTEPSWSWEPDIPIWLGVDGLMSQAPPSEGFSLIVGFPASSTSMFIDIREPIFLE